MSEVHDQGGSAFPRMYVDNVPGMTLRDYFAAAALSLAGLMPDPTDVAMDNTLAEAIASRAYELADAMLKERAK